MFFSRYVRLLFLVFLNSFHLLYALPNKDVPDYYRVTRSDYTFSTVFNMSSEKESLGNVAKNVFHIATHYDAYDRYGLYEGRGVCRLLCLGAFYSWGTEIDVYDEHENYIGMIDGQVVSTEPAKFSFYNENGDCVTIGYLDQNCMTFSLVDPENSSFVLARLTRNFIVGTVDNWDIVIYHPNHIPAHLLKIFAAFVCDTQDKFKRDL